MALLRAKWFAMGVPVGFWWGWKKSNVWGEMERVVESVLPAPVAKHVVELLPKLGTADTRQKVRLQESIRRQEETIRKLEETVRKQEVSAARLETTIRKQDETMRSLKANAVSQEAGQEQTNRLLQAVLARLPEDDVAKRQGSPPTAAPPPPPKQ